MTQPNPGSFGCVIASWGIAALGGALLAVLLMAVAGFSFVAAAFLGAVAFVVAALIFMWAFCRSLPAPGEVTIETPEVGPKDAKAEAMAEMSAKSSGGAAAKSSGSSAAASSASASAGSASTTKSSLLAGESELATRKGEWKYDGDADGKAGKAKEKAAKAAKPKGADQATPAPAPAQVEAKAKPKKAPAKKKADAATAAAESAPETLSGPRAGQTADDLKLLKGVGPGLEGTLNELGFYHFDQIAKWGAGEIAWVDSRLKFKGRIERDDWVSQAKILAEGGETEFSKRSKKGK
ncbi:putative flap endonuclease-1-like 5' DNA nuclease [Litoreibacter ponti]|uniref:Putative flap endonuclease-1-like 5' DNA nuclease n=1 Tax=Litoreibacter ponti TaxID=1510457 RepID=A0A2T6BKI9_9RHOB|nr:hypothetical protein [Litoreibacter ponti]PTX56562.1 putative flap endonuclease-1-like 5' DNA nuclease [Litoreibacter ponti]